MDFPCTSCGLCCKTVGKLLDSEVPHPFLQSLVNAFPYDTVDNVCSMLGDDGLCTTYQDRPLLCNIKALGIALGVDQNEWYKLQADTCNKVIDEFKLDGKYKVVLDF